MKTDAIGIGSVSKTTGCNIETIRYYEKIGLLDKPGRTPGGNRTYQKRHVQQLKFILRARKLGITLSEIDTLLSLSADNAKDCNAAQLIAEKHLLDVQTKIKDLRKLEKVLSNLASECQAVGESGCPILNSLSAE